MPWIKQATMKKISTMSVLYRALKQGKQFLPEGGSTGKTMARWRTVPPSARAEFITILYKWAIGQQPGLSIVDSCDLAWTDFFKAFEKYGFSVFAVQIIQSYKIL